MLEKAYLPPRRGIYRLYDLRDWFARKVHRTYHIRTVLKVVLTATFVLLAILYAARAHADTPEPIKVATCSLFDDMGVSDITVFGARDALMDKGHMTTDEAIEAIVDSVFSLCPYYVPALKEWADAPLGTYSPSKVFYGGGAAPSGSQVIGTIV